MKLERTTPCASCPYRKDARVGFWDAQHFTEVLAGEEDPMRGPMWQCHEGNKLSREERDLCVGWALDQKQRGLPSIQLRLLALTNAKAQLFLNSIHAGGAKLYASVREMCHVNLEKIRKPARRGPRAK